MNFQSGFDAGKALYEAGLVPARCTKITITVEALDVVRVDTETCMSSDEWATLLGHLTNAKEAGAVVEKHEAINAETGERFETGGAK